MRERDTLPSLSLLVLRGGDAAAATGLVDFTGPAISFFNNHRVPAALLAATAIKDAFVLQGRREVTGGQCSTSTAWRLMRYAYLLLMIISFGMEISVIFMATHVGVQLGASGGFDGYASSLVQFLVREFEYEYVSVRCQFISGVLAFLAAQALRVRYSLRRFPDLSICAMCCRLFTAAAGMLSYNNANTITFGGYSGLLLRWATLSFEFYAERCRLGKPMALFTVVTALISLAYLVRSAASSATALPALMTEFMSPDDEEDV